MMWKKIRIAFFQKPEVISEQEEMIKQALYSQHTGIEVEFFSKAVDIEFGAHFDVVITPTIPWLDEALSRILGVRWIHFLSSGVEKIWDMKFDKTSVMMSKSRGVHVNAMSEFVIGAILYFEKQFNVFAEQSKSRLWQRSWLGELSGKRLVILGAGSVGQKIADRARSFGMYVVGTVNTLREIGALDKTVALGKVMDELVDADYIVCCLPFTPKTKQLVDEMFLSQAKTGAVFVDVSRGGIVSGRAIIDALDKGILRGAALDVFEEQPLPESSPLWARNDILITPHVSGTTQHYMSRALEIFLNNYKQLQIDGTLVTPVSVELGY